MSIATLLLAFLPAVIRPNPEPEKSARELELEGERDALKEALERAWVERDSWRRRYDESQAMLARVADERIAERVGVAVTAARQQADMLAQYALAQQMAAVNPLAQARYNQQQMQNAMVYGQGAMLGAQNLALDQLWCNCVPARHDMLLGAIGGA